jgi:hypothetical protein
MSAAVQALKLDFVPNLNLTAVSRCFSGEYQRSSNYSSFDAKSPNIFAPSNRRCIAQISPLCTLPDQKNEPIEFAMEKTLLAKHITGEALETLWCPVQR